VPNNEKSISGRLDKVKLVKEIARERQGSPKPTSRAPNKKRKLLERIERKESQL
jgi:hypothetical protein